jgi:HECT-domain (ubiquitin-transferase)
MIDRETDPLTSHALFNRISSCVALDHAEQSSAFNLSAAPILPLQTSTTSSARSSLLICICRINSGGDTWNASHPTVEYFWSIVHDMTYEEKQKLLLFVTGRGCSVFVSVFVFVPVLHGLHHCELHPPHHSTAPCYVRCAVDSQYAATHPFIREDFEDA